MAARRAGLTPDVLRIWERRYGVVAPTRTGTNRRVYSDADVERLRLVGLAARAGRRISELAVLPNEALQRLVAEDQALSAARPEVSRAEQVVAECLRSARTLDDGALRSALLRALVAMPALSFLGEVVQPLMQSVGEHWEQRLLSPAHEHLASSVVRRVLQEVTEGLAAGASGPLLVVAAPAGQHHELGGLAVALAASLEGWRVAVLGGNLPAADIAEAVEQLQATALCLSCATEVEGTLDELRQVCARLGPALPILIGGRAAERLERDWVQANMQPRPRRLRDLSALRALLPTLTPV